MVGHTHEDVDAMLGHVSTWLRKHDAITVPDVNLMPKYSPHLVTMAKCVPLFLCKLWCQEIIRTFCFVYADFLKGLQEANRNSNACVISEMVDVKAWLQPHKPSCFLFHEGK